MSETAAGPDGQVAAVIVLAAGEGTRMRSSTPKVLHEICGRSMLGHVIAAIGAAQPNQVVVVTGAGRAQVEAHLAAIAPDAIAVFQENQNGTGHAVRVALAELDAVAARAGRPPLEGTVIVVPGDAPLLSGASIRALATHRDQSGAPGVVMSAIVPDPTGYGRVIRDRWDSVKRIVEHGDATPDERQITEINAAVYAFDVAKLRDALTKLTTDNAQGEEYLPDVVAIMVKSGEPVGVALIDDWREVAGVNDRVQLAQARAGLRDRLLITFMRAGVTVVDPATTWVDVDVRIEPDVEIWPNTILLGSTRIEAGAVVGPNVTARDTSIGAGAIVRDATCEAADIGPEVTVGPYTFLRHGTRLARGAKAGGFVEMKNAVVGEGSKVPHLSYVGDATIGERTNIGAATVFVNYDGVAKHATVVGDDVRIGSDTMIIGPRHIGDGAYTAAGSVIVNDVPPGALAIGRGNQRNVEGWVEKQRPGSSSAQAATRAAALAATRSSSSADASIRNNGSDGLPQSGGLHHEPHLADGEPKS